jgi:hypothetical protein
MSIEYSYEIIKVDEQNRCMEIVYTSTGREPMHVGARLPYQGESLDDVVSSFAPIWIWLEKDMVVVPPAVGHKGGGMQDHTPSVQAEQPATLESVRAEKLQEIMAWRYAREISGVAFEGVTITTDRDSQHKITGALMGMKDNFSATLDWKASDGQWITLTVEMLTALSKSVFDHVQACYQMEKTYSQLVFAATTIEEVDNIILPQ